jgi:hypothetical protein
MRGDCFVAFNEELEKFYTDTNIMIKKFWINWNQDTGNVKEHFVVFAAENRCETENEFKIRAGTWALLDFG